MSAPTPRTDGGPRPPVTKSNNGSEAPERPSLDAIAWPAQQIG